MFFLNKKLLILRFKKKKKPFDIKVSGNRNGGIKKNACQKKIEKCFEKIIFKSNKVLSGLFFFSFALF